MKKNQLKLRLPKSKSIYVYQQQPNYVVLLPTDPTDVTTVTVTHIFAHNHK